MRTYASPRPGYCASCEGVITGRPVTRRDQAYCCLGCAGGELCICTYEADMAEDGVDGLGLLFTASEGTSAQVAATNAPTAAPVPGAAVVRDRVPELVR